MLSCRKEGDFSSLVRGDDMDPALDITPHTWYKVDYSEVIKLLPKIKEKDSVCIELQPVEADEAVPTDMLIDKADQTLRGLINQLSTYDQDDSTTDKSVTTSSFSEVNPPPSISSVLKRESLALAEKSHAIGPRNIPNWVLFDVEGDGNCFFRAVAHQLQLLQHPFINTIPQGTEIHDVLRSRVQGAAMFNDGEFADYPEMIDSARELNIIIAIVDTLHPETEFLYHYINENGNPDYTNNLDTIAEHIRNRPIVRLAYTGNHYLSVIAAPADILRHNFQILENSSELSERDFERNRHSNPYIQRAFDNRFGLVLRNSPN
jgi:hypothetical protein